MATPKVRRASADDAWELVRLRTLMFEAMDGQPAAPGPWQETAVKQVTKGMSDPEPYLAAFVIDRPGEPGSIAACAVGVIDERMASPGNPGGRSGYVFNVCTEELFRRRGFAQACLLALLDWFRGNETEHVSLLALPDREALYRSLGFQPSRYTHLHRRAAGHRRSRSTLS